MNYEYLLDQVGQFHRARVLVLGDVMLDRFVYGVVDRVSPEAPIPVISVDKVNDMLGGAGNVARNIAALGAEVELIGVLGNDLTAKELTGLFASMTSIAATLITDHSRPTTIKTRYVSNRQQMLRADIEVTRPVSESIVEKMFEAFTSIVSNVDVVVLSDYAKGGLPESLVAKVIAHSKQFGKPVVVDPKCKNFEKYTGATVLTPNTREMENACELRCGTDEQVVSAAKKIIDKEICDALVVTRGADGMSVITNNHSVSHLRTTAREVFDVSGAGDTVVATLAVGLAMNADLSNLAMLANIAAGIVVGKVGTAVVTAEELQDCLEQISVAGSGTSGLLSRSILSKRVKSWRDDGYSIAFTNGCFDLLHTGHLSLLEQAKMSADKLIVGINSDESVRRLKGAGRPIQNEIVRARVLSSLKVVDAVVIFSEDTPIDLIQQIEPDVLVKGGDYSITNVVGADFVVSKGGRVVIADFVDGQSTTKTLQTINCRA